MVVVFCFNFLFLFMMNLGMGDESNRKERVSEWKMGNLETETSEIAFKGDGSLRERDRGAWSKTHLFFPVIFWLLAGLGVSCVCVFCLTVFSRKESAGHALCRWG